MVYNQRLLIFFSDFNLRIPRSGQKKSSPQQTFSLKYGFSNSKPSTKQQLFEDCASDEETNSGRSYPNERRAKINISITLPQYDGEQGKAAKFVTKCKINTMKLKIGMPS